MTRVMPCPLGTASIAGAAAVTIRRRCMTAICRRRNDLLTLGEIGIDQILVDEAQQFRKLSFATNQTSLKGIDPNGSGRAWDPLVETAFLRQRQPERPPILVSGTPISNKLGEIYTLRRLMQPEVLQARHIPEFDA